MFKRNICHISLLKDEQKEAAVHLLWLKDIVAILLAGFEESLTSTLCNGERNADVLMLKQVEEMKEFGIPSIVCQQGRTCFF